MKKYIFLCALFTFLLFVNNAFAQQKQNNKSAKITTKKMTIQQILTREGVWDSNPKLGYEYRQKAFGFDLTDDEAMKAIHKTTDVKFAFRETPQGNTLFYYAKTAYGWTKHKFFFKIEELAIKIYKENTFEGEPVLTFTIKDINEKQLTFLAEEELIFFVCDYTTDKSKFPKD